nr:hypothetical protein [Micromonospora sp. DSM 115978]
FVHTEGAPERCAVGNPPYLPASSASMGAPELWGGDDGANVSRRVLSSGFDVVMLMVSSISDPKGLLAHARLAGYSVLDWTARPITFGEYSANPAVRSRIDALGEADRAFFTASSYVLAGVTWVRDGAVSSFGRSPSAPDDHARVLERVLTSEGSTTTP